MPHWTGIGWICSIHTLGDMAAFIIAARQSIAPTAALVAIGIPAGATTGNDFIVSGTDAGEWIDEAILFKHSAEISQWKVKTIVLWCCNTGQNKNFITTLESLAKSEVFASSETINKHQLKTKNKNGESHLRVKI